MFTFGKLGSQFIVHLWPAFDLICSVCLKKNNHLISLLILGMTVCRM